MLKDSGSKERFYGQTMENIFIAHIVFVLGLCGQIMADVHIIFKNV